jgi:uncharacterized protein (DUF952 family)
MTDDLIYKIEDSAIWDRAVKAGIYEGSPLDASDGFIHLSAANQVRETAGKWFAGKAGLVLISVDTQALGEALKWEASRGGALFPHLYGPLAINAVRGVTDMGLDKDGLHVFDEAIA